MKIGKKIAYYRKKMELTQEELADQVRNQQSGSV